MRAIFLGSFYLNDRFQQSLQNWVTFIKVYLKQESKACDGSFLSSVIYLNEG